MMMNLKLLLILFFTPFFANGSARVEVNNDEKVLNVFLKIYFYGNQSYRYPEVVEEIESEWLKKMILIPENYPWANYKVNLQFDYQKVSDQLAAQLIDSNVSFENNFIRLEEGILTDESFVLSYGANCGLWYFSNGIGQSKTAAHEVGHLLGLPHPERSFVNTQDISLMATRLTEVDQAFQYQGEVRGTYGLPKLLDIRYRKLTDFDLETFAAVIGKSSQPGAQTTFNIGKVAHFYFNELGFPF